MKNRIKKTTIRNKLTTPSITDWLGVINTPSSKRLITEDYTKHDRLDFLNKKINLPYNAPIKGRLKDILENPIKKNCLLKTFNNKQCLLTLIPKNNQLTKIRKKGGMLKILLKWLQKQNLDKNKYIFFITQRNQKILWSATFIIDSQKIWGEIIKGGLSQLTRGKYNKHTPTFFSFDYYNWRFSKKNKELEQKILKKALHWLKIINKQKQKLLKTTIDAKFNKYNHLKGYFEFTIWPNKQIKFVDYNRYQASLFKGFDINSLTNQGKKYLQGLCIYPGTVKGKIRIIKKIKGEKIKKGEVLVCKMANIDDLPLLKMAKAIILEKGTILCHPAIIMRELKKPCLIQVTKATKILKTGDIVIMNATQGTITTV